MFRYHHGWLSLPSNLFKNRFLSAIYLCFKVYGQCKCALAAITFIAFAAAANYSPLMIIKYTMGSGTMVATAPLICQMRDSLRYSGVMT